MKDYVITTGVAAFVFLMLILTLALPPRRTRRVLTAIAIVSTIAALSLYGYGYGYLYVNKLKNYTLSVSILRTVFDSSRIFVGANNWGEIKEAYVVIHPFWSLCFWAIHLMAMATSASAIVVSLGTRLLKQIRLRGLRFLPARDISLIYGLNEKTLDFGRELAEAKKTDILYVDDAAKSNLETAINQMGALLRTDADALAGSTAFVKSIGMRPGKRKLYVYALDNSARANRQYAKKLLTALEKRGIRTEQTSLTILSIGDDTEHPLQAQPNKYGYGSLLAVNEADMTARILCRTYPPYKYLSFDETGKANKDFHAVVVGFGQIGQAVLRQLVMNSQFHGCTSHISVFSPDYTRQTGWLSHEYAEMLKHYNINLHNCDGRSDDFYNYLEEYSNSINYVAICAGNDTVNLEIGEKLQLFLQRKGCNAPILMCSSRGVSYLAEGDQLTTHRIYTTELLCTDAIDRRAMALHQSYQNGGNVKDNWAKAGYFDRMSSRAAADFYDALLYAAGTTEEAALENWKPEGALLENLAISEHLRWIAFHYCMGFRPMTDEEFDARIKAYPQEIEADPDYRITKDMQRRIHRCMIPWEELDELSRKENTVTGGNRDYAQNDRRIAQNLPEILRSGQ